MEDRIRNSGGRDWQYVAVAAAIVVAGFLLRINQIGQDELWFDEAFSFHMVTLASWPGDLLKYDNPPLYYLLLHAWIQLVGQSESAIRMLSAIFSTLFVVTILWIGRIILGHRAALWSGTVSALAPIQIYYAQEARAYALLTLLLALTYGSLWRALETNRRFWWRAAFICALLALYTHYFAALGLIPTALLVWLWPERAQSKQRSLRYILSVSVSGFLFLPWFLWSFWFTPHALSGSNDWIRDIWERTPPLLAIPKSLEVFTLGSQFGFTSVINVKRFGALLLPEWLHLTGLGVLALLGIWIAIPWGDKELAIPWLGRRKAWLWTLLFFPLVALWLISFYKPFYAVGRYEIVAFPAYSLLLGLALAKVQSIRKVGSLLVPFVALAFFVPIGAKLLLYYSVPPRPFAQATASALHQLVHNGDVVVLTRTRAKTTIYYLTRLGYQWEEGRCYHKSTGRTFSCWRHPPEKPRKTAASTSSRALERSEVVREEVQQYIRALHPQEGVLWVVFGRAFFSKGQLKVAPPDSFLVDELERSGLNPVPIEPGYGIFQFR